MIRIRILLALITTTVATGCVENRAPGNDREAAGDPPGQAAEMATVGEALVGVSTGLLYPEIMTDADIGTIPGSGDRCRFRFTRVGYPVFVYSPSAAVIKLNGKLVPLASSGDGVYRDGAVTVTHRELDYGDGLFAAELVLHLQDAPNELGFHGFTECPGR